MKTIPRLLAFCVAAVMLASLCVALDAPAASAATNACRVKNLDTGVIKPSLPKAVRRAKGGQRLTVRGTCHGSTVIGKDLVIIGIRAKGTGRPTLDADGLGRVLKIKPGATVKIADIRLREGQATDGGGILNLGRLTLKGTSAVVKSRAARGGGIFNTGTLRLKDRSLVAGNHADAAFGIGGGIYNEGTLVMTDSSSVMGNDVGEARGLLPSAAPTWFGGGIHTESGTTTLKGSATISRNIAGRGAGATTFFGTITLRDSSSIHHNRAVWDGGGMYMGGGSAATLADSSSVHHNTAGGSGGGVIGPPTAFSGIICGGTGNIHDNSPDDCDLT